MKVSVFLLIMIFLLPLWHLIIFLSFVYLSVKIHEVIELNFCFTGQVQSGYPVQQTVVTYPVQPAGYTAGYTAGYQSPPMQYYPPNTGYQQPPQGYPQYPPPVQTGYVGSSATAYTDHPEVKASAPPMEAPPPYPQ